MTDEKISKVMSALLYPLSQPVVMMYSLKSKKRRGKR